MAELTSQAFVAVPSPMRTFRQMLYDQRQEGDRALKQWVFNKRWFFFVFHFLLLTVIGFLLWNDARLLSLAMIAIGMALTIGYLLIIPNCFRFQKVSITVYYGFGIKTVARWEDLHHIEDHPARFGIFPWQREYHIGYFQTRNPFFAEVSVPKTKRTTAEITKYYRRIIERDN